MFLQSTSVEWSGLHISRCITNFNKLVIPPKSAQCRPDLKTTGQQRWLALGLSLDSLVARWTVKFGVKLDKMLQKHMKRRGLPVRRSLHRSKLVKKTPERLGSMTVVAVTQMPMTKLQEDVKVSKPDQQTCEREMSDTTWITAAWFGESQETDYIIHPRKKMNIVICASPHLFHVTAFVTLHTSSLLCKLLHR